MLNTLRKINWPEGVQANGGVIKAQLLSFVNDYDSLIVQANKKAEEICAEAEAKAKVDAEIYRNKIANSLKSDLENFRKLMQQERNKVIDQSADVCAEVTKIAIRNFIESMDDDVRIRSLLTTLISKLHNCINIKFSTHPEQTHLVDQVIETCFSNILRKGEYKVEADSTVEIDQIRVHRTEGAFIDVSVNNLLAMMEEEIEQIKDHFDADVKTKVLSEELNYSDEHAG